MPKNMTPEELLEGVRKVYYQYYSRQNNITIASGRIGPLNVDAGHPAVFKDDNPAAPADARYKAILRSSKPNGLLPFQSPDGLNWKKSLKIRVEM